MPTIAVRDLDIQRREHDLAVASFGRGFFVLDDYTPLRGLDRDAARPRSDPLPAEPRADMYVERFELGFPGKAFQGDSFWAAPNPPPGAVFTYYLKDELQTLEARAPDGGEGAARTGRGQPVPELGGAARRGPRATSRRCC